MPKCMQATRNRRPLGPFIARCDEKGQTNRRAGSFRTRPQASLCGHLRKPAPVKRHAAHSQAGCHRELPSRSPTMVTRLAPSIGAAGDIATLLGDNDYPPTHIHASKMPRPRFFPSGHLNFAENARRCDGAGAALVFRGKEVKRHLRRADLRPKGRGPPSRDRQRSPPPQSVQADPPARSTPRR
jgi:hypothetical protein